MRRRRSLDWVCFRIEPFIWTIVQMNGSMRKQTQSRLRRLLKDHGEHVELFSTHDASEFERLRDAMPKN